MTEEKLFIDSLIEEAEEQNKKLEQSHLDLIIMEIRKLEEQIESNFDTATKEREIIKNWALERNSMLQTRIDWLSKKLEGYLRAEDIKTLDLANGVIRLRKQTDTVSIVNEEKFLKHATKEMLNIIPETVKPDLLRLRTWIRNSGRIPPGVELVPGDIKFSYTIKKENKNGKSKAGSSDQLSHKSAVAV